MFSGLEIQSEEPLSNLVALPTELLVYIVSFLENVRDTLKESLYVQALTRARLHHVIKFAVTSPQSRIQGLNHHREL